MWSRREALFKRHGAHSAAGNGDGMQAMEYILEPKTDEKYDKTYTMELS